MFSEKRFPSALSAPRIRGLGFLKTMPRVLPFLLIFILIFSFRLQAESGEENLEIGFDEHLGSYVPLDLTFRDENGQPVVLKDFVGDKPVVLSLVYYRCPGICSPLLSGLVEVLDRMDLKPGADYRVITLSFDSRETPDLALQKKQNYFHAFQKPFPEKDWLWLTGDSASVKAITDAVGFKYKKSGDGWVHPGGIMVLGADGKISRYLFGITFLPFDLKMAIVEASQGKVGPPIARILRFCFNYDPQGRTYALDFLKISGAFVLFFAIVFIVGISVKRKTR